MLVLCQKLDILSYDLFSVELDIKYQLSPVTRSPLEILAIPQEARIAPGKCTENC